VLLALGRLGGRASVDAIAHQMRESEDCPSDPTDDEVATRLATMRSPGLVRPGMQTWIICPAGVDRIS
jgi:hypothetical protein